MELLMPNAFRFLMIFVNATKARMSIGPCLQDVEARFCVRSPGKAKQLVKKIGHRQKHLFRASGLAVLHENHVETLCKSEQN
jgi:hypothetical protein